MLAVIDYFLNSLAVFGVLMALAFFAGCWVADWLDKWLETTKRF